MNPRITITHRKNGRFIIDLGAGDFMIVAILAQFFSIGDKFFARLHQAILRFRAGNPELLPDRALSSARSAEAGHPLRAGTARAPITFPPEAEAALRNQPEVRLEADAAPDHLPARRENF